MTKAKSPPAYETILRTQGAKLGLFTLKAIANYLGYKHERNFLNRVRLRSFDLLELQQIFDRLYFSDDDILKFWGRYENNT